MEAFTRVTVFGCLAGKPLVQTSRDHGHSSKFMVYAGGRSWRDEAGIKRDCRTFIECYTFGNKARELGERADKGTPLFLGGRIKMIGWHDKDTGAVAWKIGVLVDEIRVLTVAEAARAVAEQLDTESNEDQ